MARENETEVLVVGAGPVGMLTALLLAEKGVTVNIIDRDTRPATRSYACVLHPGTLKILDDLGLAQEAISLGRRIETIAFYEGESRRAEINLPQLPSRFPCAVVLSQSAFENLLEKQLRRHDHVSILWNHRLADLKFEPDTVTATIDKLTQSAKGYIVREWDWAVEKKIQTRARFTVGADGHASMVRSRLGLEYERVGDPELFALFEFQTNDDPGNEVRIVLSGETTNVLWPLPGNGCRWSFQLVKTKEFGEFPDKEREAPWSMRTSVDQTTRDRVERLARIRAPWFKGGIGEFYWWAHLRLQRTLAKQFGKARTWLAGDAAHQTGPVGVQSMNVGLAEGAHLAATLAKILHENASLELLETYNRVHHQQWEKLLGLHGYLKNRPDTPPWVKEHSPKLLSCLPASGEDLVHLANQLKLDA